MITMHYSIDEVSQICNVSAAQLRNWEVRYGFPKPKRSKNGRRQYSEADLEFLKKTANWLKNGVRPVDIGALYLKEGNKVSSRAFATQSPGQGVSALVHEELNQIYFELASGSLRRASLSLKRLYVGQSPDSILQNVLMPLVFRFQSWNDEPRLQMAYSFLWHEAVYLSRMVEISQDELPHVVVLSLSYKMDLSATILATKLGFSNYYVDLLQSQLSSLNITQVCHLLKPEGLVVSIDSKLHLKLLEQLNLGVPILAYEKLVFEPGAYSETRQIHGNITYQKVCHLNEIVVALDQLLKSEKAS